jgi:hypothetical protein
MCTAIRDISRLDPRCQRNPVDLLILLIVPFRVQDMVELLVQITLQ